MSVSSTGVLVWSGLVWSRLVAAAATPTRVVWLDDSHPQGALQCGSGGASYFPGCACRVSRGLVCVDEWARVCRRGGDSRVLRCRRRAAQSCDCLNPNSGALAGTPNSWGDSAVSHRDSTVHVCVRVWGWSGVSALFGHFDWRRLWESPLHVSLTTHAPRDGRGTYWCRPGREKCSVVR